MPSTWRRQPSGKQGVILHSYQSTEFCTLRWYPRTVRWQSCGFFPQSSCLSTLPLWLSQVTGAASCCGTRAVSFIPPNSWAAGATQALGFISTSMLTEEQGDNTVTPPFVVSDSWFQVIQKNCTWSKWGGFSQQAWGIFSSEELLKQNEAYTVLKYCILLQFLSVSILCCIRCAYLLRK